MSKNKLGILAENRQALLLAEAIGWLHDYRKCSEEHLQTQSPGITPQVPARTQLAKMSKPQQQEYEKAKKWWECEGRALNEQSPKPIEPTPGPIEQWLQHEFASFIELLKKVEEVGKALVAVGDEE